jgi:NADH:ubiquinone oxidoreductase subunit 4 (subunit M)
MIQRVYLGKRREEYADFPDATARETAILFPMAVLCLFMGVLPGPVFALMNGTIENIVALFPAIGG